MLDVLPGKAAQEFPKGSKWLNTNEQLSLSKMSGYIVILDFWTYCCINCMHMIPVLSKLEEKYRDDPVIFIGVHSAKFKNEQNPENISEAIARYGISHPVVVDENMHLWKTFGASAWPTFVFIDPHGKVAFRAAGEPTFSALETEIEKLLSKHKDALSKEPFKISAPERKVKGILSYPGKISFSRKDRGEKFALSDSNHNRILVIETQTGKILKSIGSGAMGMNDGPSSSCSFNRPQGVFWSDDTIYVADTENHSIREIDLINDAVSTTAGNGTKGAYVSFSFRDFGKNIALNSPWDIAKKDNLLFIAMAGFHQIWTYDTNTKLTGPYAGTGIENIMDGNLGYAEFAQPSGLGVSGNNILVADSEASAIRSISIKEKYVSTLVGSGLFSFGNRDGNLAEAQLQHPIGISLSNDTVYIADTYNHSIKILSLDKKEVRTLVGNKTSKSFCRFDDPECDTLGLYEPNDVKQNGDSLYIADTNNHLVRIFDIKSMLLKTLKITE